MARKYVIILFSLLLFILIISFSLNINRQSVSEPEKKLVNGVELSVLPADIATSLNRIRKRITGKGSYNLEILKSKEDNVITEDTPLVLRIQGKKVVTSTPSYMVGLNSNQIADNLVNWEIAEFEPEARLVLERNNISISKHRHYLGIKDNRVAIFYGQNNNFSLEKKTSISLENIPVKERRKLENGIKVDSEEELLTILEGLKSYTQD